MKRSIRKLLMISIIVSTITGCSNNNSTQNQTSGSEKSTKLSFQKDDYTSETMTVDGKDITYRAYENIVYVENPVDTQYQCMNIYVPEEYFNEKSIGEFTSDNAPIFLPNGIGGYLPAEPSKPSMEGEIGGDASRVGLTTDSTSSEESPNSLLMALSKGYVVASPGARGRSTESEDGIYTGKAPAGLVDLKAAVRYLYYNDDVIPGDANKIISNGTSAGGAMSSLLGATGNNSDYEPYLTDLGAADAKDNVFAVSAYCPITNLENADKAYEWLFNGIINYTSMNISKDENGNIQRKKEEHTLTSDEIKYSNELKSTFPTYVNSLNLKDGENKLTLNENGDGSFKDYAKSYIINSAQDALDSGTDLSNNTWITIENNKVTDIDLDGYVEYIGRSKGVPAFDNINLTAPENNLFGTAKIDNQHFTDFSLSKDENGGTKADAEIIKMMNPMKYIGVKNTDTAKYWRIRHGLEDSDTALAIPVILNLKLINNKCNVDFAIPWGQGHGGDYDLEELFTWMDSISKK